MFVPPACAMSGRPPPPDPPRAAAPTLTRSTALILPVRSSVTATTIEAFPSEVAISAITPEPILPLRSSAMGFKLGRNIIEHAGDKFGPAILWRQAPHHCPTDSHFTAQVGKPASSFSPSIRFDAVNHYQYRRDQRFSFCSWSSSRRAPPRQQQLQRGECPIPQLFAHDFKQANFACLFHMCSSARLYRERDFTIRIFLRPMEQPVLPSYFSPNKARAPDVLACSKSMRRVTTSVLAQISSFTFSRPHAIARASLAWCETSKRVRSWVWSDPFARYDRPRFGGEPHAASA